MSVVRLRRRGGRRPAGLVVACLLAASGAAGAQTPRPPLVVQQVVPDRTTDTLTIDGAHFGAEPFVTLDLVPLELRVALETRIMAAVPVDAMPPGRYLLTVSRGPDATDRASIEVTIGAAAAPAAASSAPAPPLARPGPAPAAGDAAAIVGDRTITIGEVDREWQATDPGSYLALMRELYEHRRRIADAMSTSDLLAREAAARSMTTEALLAEEVPKRLIAMPDTALTALYESLGDRTRGAALEKMRPSLRAWLERKTEAELAKMAYIEELVKTSSLTRSAIDLAPRRVEAHRIIESCTAPARQTPATSHSRPGAQPNCAASIGPTSGPAPVMAAKWWPKSTHFDVG